MGDATGGGFAASAIAASATTLLTNVAPSWSQKRTPEGKERPHFGQVSPSGSAGMGIMGAAGWASASTNSGEITGAMGSCGTALGAIDDVGSGECCEEVTEAGFGSGAIETFATSDEPSALQNFWLAG
jgi:hypothetical protein